MQEQKIVIDGKETNYIARDDGTIWNCKTNRQLQGTLARNEYLSIQLTVEGCRKTIMVHRLIASIFCPNPNNYTIVHHKDGNRLNNCADNLQWVTTQENNQVENRKKMERIISPLFNPDFQLDNNWKPLDDIDSNYYICSDGRLWNNKTKKFPCGSLRNGYRRYNINDKAYSAHILVWENFKGQIPKGYVIDHIDGVRDNNNLSNLRLISQSENMYNAMANGHKGQRGVKQIDSNNNIIQIFISIAEAARYLQISRDKLVSIIKQKKEYNNSFWQYVDSEHPLTAGNSL